MASRLEMAGGGAVPGGGGRRGDVSTLVPGSGQHVGQASYARENILA